MRTYSFALLGAIALTSGAIAQTYVVHTVTGQKPDSLHAVKIAKAALSGQEIRVWWASLLNADCSPEGTMTTQVVQPPLHGNLKLSDDAFYPSYPSPNPRAVCDSKPAAGKQAFYTSAAGFHGHDRMVLQNATSEGRMRRIAIDVDVR